jgi:tetratricopeptide (TPR) repeat protein
MQRALHFQRDDSPEAKLGKLEGTLAQYLVSLPEVMPLFVSLLSLPLPERYPPLTLTPQRQKQQTLEAVLTVLLTLAEQQPVLFIMEDLHWVDPSTLELLSLLVDQGPTARVFTLLTCRPEFRLPWSARSHLTQFTLSRLPRTQVEVMVERVAEVVLESGLLREREDHYELTGPLPPLAIPTTLHDSLMARLDRLAAVKEVAQLGATLGRTFSYELLQAVTPLDDAALQQALAQLVAAELLYQRGIPPQATYFFKHALIQEAAYQSLLKSTRQQSHQRIAQVLEARFPETRETQPELLAYHYTEAGLGAPAVSYWHQAGQRAMQRSATVEAIAHLTKGLEVLTTLPDIPERTRQELSLRTALGPALMITRGVAAPEVEQTYLRIQALAHHVEETPRGLWLFYYMRGEIETAHELGAQLLDFAQRRQEPTLLFEAHMVLGFTLFRLGEVLPARAHLEQSIALYDPTQHRALALLLAVDPGVTLFCYAARNLWLLGYPTQALEQSQAALTLASELAHPFSLAYALTWTAFLQQLRRDWHAVQERAADVIRLSTEQGFPFLAEAGTFLQGWALTEQEQWDAGIAQMSHALAGPRAAGVDQGLPYWLALLAEAYGKSAQTEEGLALLSEALAVAHKAGGRYWEAELYRLKGVLLLHQRPPDETQAETWLSQALATARRQQVKAWELRAAMSLSRLWQQQGKRADSRQRLAAVYGWFTEGFDTADLQEARALLEELS